MRKIDPARACLHVEKWPEADQALWREIVCGDNFESDLHVRPNWRPKTMQSYREGYGRWINHLVHAKADLALPPADRVTPELVKQYLKRLREQGLAPQTRANRISELMSVMLVFAPDRDWNWLRQMFNRQASIANHQRKPRPLTLLAGDILGPTMQALNAARKKGTVTDFQSAVRYRNWLMLGVLIFTPLRRDNFANLALGTHLTFLNGEWMTAIPVRQVKQKKTIKMPIPVELNPHIEFYLKAGRPVLLAGRASDRLWITNRHTGITSHSVYIAITNFTQKEFGQRINPHQFRHIAATSTVIGNPEQTEEARAHLTHSDKRMTEDHYIIAKSLATSREHALLISGLRRQLPVACSSDI